MLVMVNWNKLKNQEDKINQSLFLSLERKEQERKDKERQDNENTSHGNLLNFILLDSGINHFTI